MFDGCCLGAFRAIRLLIYMYEGMQAAVARFPFARHVSVFAIFNCNLQPVLYGRWARKPTHQLLPASTVHVSVFSKKQTFPESLIFFLSRYLLLLYVSANVCLFSNAL